MPGTVQIRDDNLRLLFAAVTLRELDERRRAMQSGGVVLAVFVLLFLSAVVVRLAMLDPLSEPLAVETVLHLNDAAHIAMSMFLLTAGAVTLLSPLIALVLFIERRRVDVDIAEHEALLARYNRL